jgi:hypothetical protein
MCFCYYISDCTVVLLTNIKSNILSRLTRLATGMDGPGIESQWGRDFPHPSRPALGPTQPPVQCVPGHFRE